MSVNNSLSSPQDLAAADAQLSARKPAAAPAAGMLHEAFRFRVAGDGGGVGTPMEAQSHPGAPPLPLLELQRLVPALDTILGKVHF